MLYETTHASIRVSQNKNFRFVAHAHHHLELYICIEGRCAVSCNFRSAVLTPGQAMIAFSNDVHAYMDTEVGKGILVIVDPSLAPKFVSSQKGVQYQSFMTEGDPRLVESAQQLLAEYHGDRSMDVMIGYIYVILGTAVKKLPVADRTSTVDSRHFSAILKYISENYTQKLSLTSISEQFGISACHLSRTFSQKLSCTFLKYLHSLRVEHAKNLLTHSDMSILEIAFESGFSDPRTFNRVFREREKMSPGEYRGRS